MTQPLIYIVILNSNRRDDTLACLASISKSTYKEIKVILLDNKSTDGSVEAVQASFPKVQIINLSTNLGYAGNNNVGINMAIDQRVDWVFVLNEDTILDPDCISSLIKVGQGDPGIGVLGPMVYHYDEPWSNTMFQAPNPRRSPLERGKIWAAGSARSAARSFWPFWVSALPRNSSIEGSSS